MLNADALRDKGEQYAGDLELTHPAVSPIYGDLTGLCKITVFVGSREIFCADAYRLRDIADEYELDIDVNVFKNQMHFFVSLPIPEADLAFAIMASELYGVEDYDDKDEEEEAAEEAEEAPEEAEAEEAPVDETTEEVEAEKTEAPEEPKDETEAE